MLTNDDIRSLLGRPALTDAEIAAFLVDLDVFLAQCLDEYFRSLGEPSDG